MTTEILDVINQRRQLKNKDNNKYKQLRKILRQSYKQAKENCAKRECGGIEALQEKHDGHTIYEKVKQKTELFRNGTSYQLVNIEIKVCKPE